MVPPSGHSQDKVATGVLSSGEKFGLEIQNVGFGSQMVKAAMRRMRLPKESEKRCRSKTEESGT